MRKKSAASFSPIPKGGYADLLGGLTELLEEARRVSVRSVNAVMTATYWEVGRRIVEHEQRGKRRAEYGEQVLRRLASDLTARFGRGFGLSNLKVMKKFYLTYEARGKGLTVSGQLAPVAVERKGQTASGLSSISPAKPTIWQRLPAMFPQSWSH